MHIQIKFNAENTGSRRNKSKNPNGGLNFESKKFKTRKEGKSWKDEVRVLRARIQVPLSTSELIECNGHGGVQKFREIRVKIVETLNIENKNRKKYIKSLENWAIPSEIVA